MLDHFVIEANKITAGVAIRVPGGFRFFHSDPRFRKLEDQIYRKARVLARRAREIALRLRRGSEPESSRFALT